MNYLMQINTFYRILPNNSLSSNAQCLYWYLLFKNNELGWIKEFSIANSIVSGYTELNIASLQRARNELIQKNYINYKKGKAGRAGNYSIIRLYDQNSIDFEQHNEHRNDSATNKAMNTETNNATNNETSTLTKLNKTKLNETNKKEKSKKEKTALDVIKNSGLDDDVINLLVEFKKMRDLKKKPLTAYAMELRIKELNNLSADKTTQLEIIKQTITSNWDRFYPLKKQKVTNNWAYINNKKNQYKQRQFEDFNSLYD